MKIETAQTQTQSLQNKVNDAKRGSIKPTFKEIPDEFVSETMENAGEHNGLFGYIASGLAAIGAGVAFFRNRKARIAKQIAKNEKEIAQRAKTEAEDALARLKAENEALNKSIDEWNEAILSPTKNKGSNKTGESQAYSSGSSKSSGNPASSGTKTGYTHSSNNSNKTEGSHSVGSAKAESFNENIGTKGTEALNEAQHSANISMTEEDKKYFEKSKQELLEMIDKAGILQDHFEIYTSNVGIQLLCIQRPKKYLFHNTR